MLAELSTREKALTTGEVELGDLIASARASAEYLDRASAAAVGMVIEFEHRPHPP